MTVMRAGSIEEILTPLVRGRGGEEEREGGALAWLALHLDATLERARDLAADGEAQPGALAARLGGVEGLEDALALLGRDAGAGVRHLQRQQAVVAAGAHGQLAALPHGVDRVGDEV